MNRHERGMHKLLTQNYLHKTTIRDAFNCSYEKASEIFDLAKAIELEKSLIDIRPNAVQSLLVLKVTGSNFNHLRKQFRERMEQK